jgi:hypothetical protein
MFGKRSANAIKTIHANGDRASNIAVNQTVGTGMIDSAANKQVGKNSVGPARR